MGGLCSCAEGMVEDVWEGLAVLREWFGDVWEGLTVLREWFEDVWEGLTVPRDGLGMCGRS